MKSVSKRPNVKFYCDLDYDPFLFMQENKLKYGFTITMKEYEATIPSLWNVTKGLSFNLQIFFFFFDQR